MEPIHEQKQSRLRTAVFAITVFLGAFLLFQVQPILGRYALPLFGGSPEVWTTCMLFFQVFLLAGYAYAHFINSRLSPPRQLALHLALIVFALIMLPIIPNPAYRPDGQANPIIQILLMLTGCVALPYLLLASNSPLTQAWFTKANPNTKPWRLYALSNAGSLLALLSYPFVFEPTLTRQTQATLWSWGFAVFAGLNALCALLVWKSHKKSTAPITEPNDQPSQTTAENIPLARRLLWFALPWAAVVELLAVTNTITQDITVVPFLWVLPLCLYLLSFIITFDHQRWYIQKLWIGLFIAAIAAVIYVRQQSALDDPNIIINAKTLVAAYCFLLFTCCMVCHGEVYRLRPHASKLTSYYLSISTGGALGGIFVAIIAPAIFSEYTELYVGLLATVLFVLLANDTGKTAFARRRKVVLASAVVLVAVTGAALQGKRSTAGQRAVANTRNFFGVLTIWEEDWNDPAAHKYIMQHGTTFHGLQFTDPEKRLLPTSYYGPESGVGVAMDYLQQNEPDLNIGVVGLGVGTISTYGRPDDYIRFYEINPAVEDFAREYFTYLSDTKADTDVVIGDARLSLEAEQNAFDLLVLDAFSSDAVPIHLLTREAFRIYLDNLKPDGIMALHISSQHLDLAPVIARLAQHFNLAGRILEPSRDNQKGTFESTWILLTPDQQTLTARKFRLHSFPLKPDKDTSLWTDDFVNPLEVLEY
ncbi:spermidine synthase [Anaerohalosphaera lusitana]|uniref:Spermidine synthase n=1 Tax=Anaerohalosphaera lusitana TaxID=1936003 RepID=A0A1U9NPN8_9BACT|nr:fused MFS/spermidine synthase [Anaerohalosphaera lusitana]AQT69891.1 spermidine synthase [Anaerohalosphaera lusitana]